MLKLDRGVAELAGTVTNPHLLVRTGYDTTHAETGEPLRAWLKELPGARWSSDDQAWIITGTYRHPDAAFNSAGISVSIDPNKFPGVTSLEDIYWPISKLDSNGHTTLVRHRLAGFVATQFTLGKAAVWDKTEKLFRVPVLDVYKDGALRPNVIWDGDSQWAAYRMLTEPAWMQGFEDHAYNYGRALAIGPQSTAWAEENIGTFPEWWDATLFPFQLPGALSVLMGHRLLADPPGLGKTIQFIAATAMRRAKRILVVCPPVVAVHWGREFEKVGYPHDIAVFRAGRKEPALPDEGVIVVPDSLITSREELRKRIIEWAPDMIGLDEAHRIKNWASKRTQALLDVAHHVPVQGRVAITGTPVISGPHELVPLLLFTGLMGPVFGSVDGFLTKFTTQPPFGGFQPRQAALPELNITMQSRVWVRREKERVLPFLPAKRNERIDLLVDTKPYREAHNEVIEKITEWVESCIAEYGAPPGPEEVDDFVAQSLEFVSLLRRASAITKIPTAVEMIQEHLTADPDNDSPLVCWVHHREVMHALAEMLDEHEIEYRILMGGTTAKQRQEAIDDYQAGKVQVLIAGLTAAGVGVTLTRGREAIFIECDWTPAIVSQAIDRLHRIGQTHPVYARTLVALNTLDEHVQRILEKKGNTAEKIHGDDHSTVAVLTGGDQMSARELLRELVTGVLSKHSRKAKQ